ncbi:MAG: PASTA domain-containing protein [Bacteroidetes bacterium]|nr:PASTA domain-containing protein [Bacteroidota bacterium]
MKDAHPPHTTEMSIQHAFETSSNVGISMAIWKSYVKRPDQFVKKLQSFGLNTPLGLDIQGEGKPRIKNVTDKDWFPVSLPWMSIGYEVKLTPLQILNFYNTVANNGRMVRPHFVKEIQNHGKVLRSFGTEIIRDSIASPQALAKARQILEGVVQNGTASELKKSPYKIAGKTGTAQMTKNKFGYDKENPSYQASFVGYFPADAPKYSCMVVVYAPSNDVYYGGAVAAPIFKEIADKVYSNHLELHTAPLQLDTNVNVLPLAKVGMQKDLKKVCSALNVPMVSKDADARLGSSTINSDAVVTSERKTIAGIVPNVNGMGAKDAIAVLENAGLRVRMRGKGLVTRQSIEAGTRIQRGQIIQIELGL